MKSLPILKEYISGIIILLENVSIIISMLFLGQFLIQTDLLHFLYNNLLNNLKFFFVEVSCIFTSLITLLSKFAKFKSFIKLNYFYFFIFIV